MGCGPAEHQYARPPARLHGHSPDYLAVSDLNRGIAWKTGAELSIRDAHHHGFVMEFDVHDHKVLLLGHQQLPDGSMSSEGEIAWLGSLADGGDRLKTVLYSPIKASKDAPMGTCGWLAFGGVRFLTDGSFMVVPGVEPNAFLFSPEGQLRRTWDTNDLGIDTGCSFAGVDGERWYDSVAYRYRRATCK